ncbi:Apoptosis-inducing factor 2 [Tolypocladium paradoxum]|uniref:Apoptosis-inducing factor 2 n=1 Tax=Tolypocladium paradoxum TaxID=94208 RepID=A0A2S4L6C2_9HYPO|nr:Apoptosis-inducing factor 2 [Tolypocladium paradoxum]
MTQSVVILGAGWAGLPLAHKLLKYTAPKTSLRVILVTPNSHFFWNVAATRGIIPGEIPDSALFLPIAPGFSQYPAGAFELVLGTAEGIDQAANTVDIAANDGQQRHIPYDQLVIATGSKISSGLPLKPLGNHSVNVGSWHALQKRVGEAKTIVIAGAGATGVEVAGELAARYGSAKEITLVVSGNRPFEGHDGISPSVGATVDRDLQNLGVKLMRNTRVALSEESGDGKSHTLTLSNGSTLEADCYLPLFGIQVNTSFVPKELLDAKGNVQQDQSLRVVGTENMWAMGDVGNTEAKQLTLTDAQIVHMAAALDATLTGSGSVAPYRPEEKTMIFIAMGRRFATGQIGGWKLWRFLVSYAKGRKLFVGAAAGYVGGKHLRHASM